MLGRFKAVALLVTLSVSEHWVCAIPDNLSPDGKIIFDYEVAGNELIEKSPSKLILQIIRNDARQLLAIWFPELMPQQPGGTMVLIDKDDGSFRRTILYTHFDLSDAGTCKMTP
jgi:hypothetical protein